MAEELLKSGEEGLNGASRSGELSKIKFEGEDDLKKFGLDPKYYEIGDEGKLQFKMNGKTIPIEDLKNDYYDWNTGEAPDFAKILEKLGFEPEQINDEGIQKLIDKSTKDFNEKWKPFQDMKKLDNDSKALEKTHPEPKNAAELDENKEVNKNTLDKIKENAGKIGKWVAGFVAVGLAADTIYNLVKSHQEACNGCWKINLSDPSQKCKISNLTCSENARNSGGTCSNCTKNDRTQCQNSFNPCLIDSNSKFYKTCTDASGAACGKKDKDGNSYYLGPGSGSTLGPNCSNPVKDPSNDKTGCPSTDDDNWCSSNCSCDKSDNCGDGTYTMQCVKLNFWAALADAVDTPIQDVGNWFTDTEKTILYILKVVAIIIIVLISAYVIYKIVMYFMQKPETNENSEHNHEESDIHSHEESDIEHIPSLSSRRNTFPGLSSRTTLKRRIN